MDDHVADALEGDARAPSDMHRHTATVDGLVGRDHELPLQFDGHAGFEDNPEGSRARHGVAESPGRGVRRVVVAWGGDPVEGTIASSYCAFSESLSAVGKALAVSSPVPVTAPAVVDWISRLAPASA